MPVGGYGVEGRHGYSAVDVGYAVLMLLSGG